MRLIKTTRNDDEGTSKETLRIDDNWMPACHFHPTDERIVCLVIEDLDNRFVLDLYVTDREATVNAFDKLFDSLQELQIEQG